MSDNDDAPQRAYTWQDLSPECRRMRVLDGFLYSAKSGETAKPKDPPADWVPVIYWHSPVFSPDVPVSHKSAHVRIEGELTSLRAEMQRLYDRLGERLEATEDRVDRCLDTYGDQDDFGENARRPSLFTRLAEAARVLRGAY